MLNQMAFGNFNCMKQLGAQDIERLIRMVIDDLVDECAHRDFAVRNGKRQEAMALVKEAIRLKQSYLAQAYEIESTHPNNSQLLFRGMHADIRRQSLSLIERMRHLGL